MTLSSAHRKALFIASGSYSDERLGRLRSPVPDAEALSAILGDPNIGAFDSHVIADQGVLSVQRELEKLFNSARPDDLVLVHLSGHGLKTADGGLMFLTADSELDTPRASSLRGSFLHELMSHSRARQQVVMIDCCFSGAITSDMIAKAAISEFDLAPLSGRGRIIISASTAAQESFEIEDSAGEPTSVFTRELVVGLDSGKADADGDGKISLRDLFTYACDNLRSKYPAQSPTWNSFEEEQDIEIARVPLSRSSINPLPDDLLLASANGFPSVRLAVIEELRRFRYSPSEERASAAKQMLSEMKDDASDSVSRAANAALRSRRGSPRTRKPIQIEPSREKVWISTDADSFRDAIRFAATYASQDDARVVLTGVLLEVVNGQLVAVATDSYRLAVEGPLDVSGQDGICLARADDLLAAIGVLETGVVEIALGNDGIELIQGDRATVAQTIDGAFPNYRNLIPESDGPSVEVNRADFLTVVETVLAQSDESSPITIRGTATAIHAASSFEDPEVLQGRIPSYDDGRSIRCTSEAEDWTVSFNPIYLRDALASFDGVLIQLRIVDSGSRPVIFRNSEQPRRLVLLMPVRIP